MAKSKEKDWGNFEPLTHDDTYRLIFRSWGWDKVGKNHFGYTMPDPILGLYLDPGGAEGVAQKFLRGENGLKKDIRQIQYRFNKVKDDQSKAIELRDQWMEDYAHALTIARSVQWDESETWELFRFAEFGRESNQGREYGPINGMYRGLIQDAFDAGVNLQMIQKVKAVWKNDKPTDDMEPLGFKQAGNIVQVSLEHSWDADEGFKVKIVNARQNTAIWGMELTQEEDNISFQHLGVLVYPDSNMEDWE
jgi:hypothetical protein